MTHRGAVVATAVKDVVSALTLSNADLHHLRVREERETKLLIYCRIIYRRAPSGSIRSSVTLQRYLSKKKKAIPSNSLKVIAIIWNHLVTIFDSN